MAKGYLRRLLQVTGTMDLVYAAINSGTGTLNKNAENRVEFIWIKWNFKAICKKPYDAAKSNIVESMLARTK